MKDQRQGHTKTKLKMLKEIRKMMTMIFKACLEPQIGKFPAILYRHFCAFLERD